MLGLIFEKINGYKDGSFFTPGFIPCICAAKGFGKWYGDTTDLQTPATFEPMLALKMIGYDIKDSTAAITTFKRKFLQNENHKPLTDSDKKVLYAVWRESMK